MVLAFPCRQLSSDPNGNLDKRTENAIRKWTLFSHDSIKRSMFFFFAKIPDLFIVLVNFK